jgi:predicted ribosomally synthesized peptide with nif11-like leader
MTTKEFVAKLNQDAKENNTEIVAKIQAVGKDPEAVYAIAKEAGVTDSFEDFKAEMTAQYEAMSKELSEDDLAAIAGGSFWGTIAGIAGAAAGGGALAAATLGLV